MDSALTSDIFFFIASIGFIVLGIGWLVLIYFAVKIAREASILAQEAKDTFLAVREHLKEQPFVGKFFTDIPEKKPRARKKKETL